MGFFDSWKVKVKAHLRHYVLYPGNIVEGFAEINVSSPIEFVAVRVKVAGKERVTIRRERPQDAQGNRPPPEVFLSNTCTLKQLVTLAGQLKCSNNRNKMTMPAGTFYYPFSFQLPPNIPASFSKMISNDYAEIVYYVKVYVDIPMGRDASVKNFFTVVKPMPANQWIQRGPVSIDRYFDVTCCCCIDKGKVNARFFMDRTLIAIDRDNLLICVNVDNTLGKEKVESAEISLMHTLIYTAQGVTERNMYAAGKQFLKQEILPGAKGQIFGTVPLPRNLIPSLRTFNVVSEYAITLEINIPWATDPCQKFPVMVAQSVDDSNFSPPCAFNENSFRPLGKNEYSEFYYQPPPHPCYSYTPIPLPPPPNAPMYNPNFQIAPLGLPSNNWAQGAPPMFQGQPQQYNSQGVQWQQGYAQQQNANYVIPTAQVSAPTYASGQNGNLSEGLLS